MSVNEGHSEVSVAEDDELLRCQPLEPDWPARVEFVGADADLGTEPVLEAVGKTRRRIDHYRAGIHFTQKTPRTAQVFCHDNIGMV